MAIEAPQPIDPVDKVQSAASSSESPAGPQEKKIKSDPGLSTIEESELLATLLVPLISVPILIPPEKNDAAVEGLSSILVSMSERKKMDFLFGLVEQMGEITSTLNQIFMESLERIIDETHRVLNSSAYKDEKAFKSQGHYPDQKIDEIAGPTSVADKIELKSKIKSVHEDFLSSIQGMDNLSKDVKGIEKLEIPFTVLFAVAGSLALGKLNRSNEASDDVIKLVQQLHPLVPQVKMEEILPLINLMVMAPIIFRPLDEGIQNQKGAPKVDTAKLVQNFAKDVLKMVTDPTFALLKIVNNIEQMERLNPEQKQAFVAFLKLILLSVALSLMYSLEVGKIIGEKFFGMEPQEFKALLDPDKPLIKEKPEKDMNANEKLVSSLINQIRLQISQLPPEGRSEAIESILSFLKQSHRVSKLLDPSKVLTDVLQSMNYKLPMNSYLHA